MAEEADEIRGQHHNPRKVKVSSFLKAPIQRCIRAITIKKKMIKETTTIKVPIYWSQMISKRINYPNEIFRQIRLTNQRQHTKTSRRTNRSSRWWMVSNNRLEKKLKLRNQEVTITWSSTITDIITIVCWSHKTSFKRSGWSGWMV